jgi:riboflavin biosynthesis pyrimidine reductase
LSIPEGSVYGNFVSSIDGIVALEGGTAPSGGIISGRNEGDRFVMGLLRAFADAVLVGAGTVRAEGGRHLWTPDYIFPAGTDAFQALRRSLKRDSSPRLVIVTAGGRLNPDDGAIQAGALVLTTAQAAGRLRKLLPAATQVRAVTDADRITVDEIFGALEVEGLRTILTEGGPMLFGQLLAAQRTDQLFLTVSPVLERQTGDSSFGLVRGIEFGRQGLKSRLVSVRRQDSHLFLRYQLPRAA